MARLTCLVSILIVFAAVVGASAYFGLADNVATVQADGHGGGEDHGGDPGGDPGGEPSGDPGGHDGGSYDGGSFDGGSYGGDFGGSYGGDFGGSYGGDFGGSYGGDFGGSFGGFDFSGFDPNSFDGHTGEGGFGGFDPNSFDGHTGEGGYGGFDFSGFDPNNFDPSSFGGDFGKFEDFGSFGFTDPGFGGGGDYFYNPAEIFDPHSTGFYDPSSGHFVGADGVQFFDSHGAVIDPESAQFAEGGFTFDFRSDEAMAAFAEAAGFNPGDFAGQGGEFSFDLAKDMDFTGFQDLGEHSIFSMFEAMGDQFHDLSGGQMAGMFSGMNEHQLGQIGGEQIFEAMEQWGSGDFAGMSGDQAMAMYNTMDTGQAHGLGGEQLSGLFGAMDPSGFQDQFSHNEMVDALNAMGFDQAMAMGGDSLAGMFGAMEAADIRGFDSFQMGQAFDQMEGAHFGFIDAESAAAMMESFGFDHALAAGGEQIAGILGAMDGADLGRFDSGRLAEAFDQMEGGHFGFMDAESAAAMMESFGFDHALAGGGEQIAGILGAMDGADFGTFDSSQIGEAFEQMEASHFGFIDSDSAIAMLDSIGIDLAVDGGADKLSGLMGAMDPAQYGHDISIESVIQAFDAMGFEQALTMGGDNLAGIFGVMDAADLGRLDPEQMGQAYDQMKGGDFSFIDAESAAAMMESFGFDHALAAGGEQIAGIMGAMDQAGLSQFDAEQLGQAYDAMKGSDIRSFMDPNSAAAMLETIGIDQAAIGGGEKLAGLVGAIDPAQYGQQIDKETVLEAFDALTVDQALTMGGDNLAGIFGVMDEAKVGQFTPEDLQTFANNMTGKDIEQYMDPDSAFGMFTNLTPDQKAGLEQGQMGAMFGAMDAAKISEIADFGSDMLFGGVSNVPGTDFQFVDAESALAIYNGVGEQARNLDGDQLAGLLGAMDHDQIVQNIGVAEVFDLASSIQGQDWSLMDKDSAFAMIEEMGVSQALELEETQVAGMVNSLDAGQFQTLGADQVGQIASFLEGDLLAGLANEAAVGMGSAMSADQFGQMNSAQVFGLTTAINATGIGNLGGEVLEVIAESLEVSDISSMDNELAGGIFGGVSDQAIQSFDLDRLEATLDALNADFFNAGGAGFDSITGGGTTFDLFSIEAPDSLQNVIGDNAESIFGGNLFGG